MYDFDAMEAVDQLIDEINAGYYSESYDDEDEYVTGEQVYESIHSILCDEVEAGNITLEFANEVNDMAYDKYVVESGDGGAVLVSVAALAGVVAVIIKVINHFKSKKGYKNDPDLAKLRDDAVALKKKIDSSQANIRLTYDRLMKSVREFNSLAEKYNAPTITLNSSNTSAKEVKETIHQITNEAEGTVREKQSSKTDGSSREEINKIYDPAKAMEFKKQAEEVNRLADQYYSVWMDFLSEVSACNALRKRLNKIARAKVHSPEDKAAVQQKLTDIDAQYKETLADVKKIK